LQGVAEEGRAVKAKIFISLLVCVMGSASPVTAGFDAASVPEERMPWSGYWWPILEGELVHGYTDQPSPLEKYDAYVTGYYPAAAVAQGLVHEYDPEGEMWYGHCDSWAAASILEAEPRHTGNLKGIPFRIGDKKGLLTLLYERYAVTRYGTHYWGPADDPNDIYPGGVDGFHQTLINYISNQGLPIVAEIDPGLEVWSFPIYRYEMEWVDEGDTRHVTCKVWMADDFVSPDFLGTQEVTQTYTYALKIDGHGNILDEPGYWEGESVDSHPDYLWFPISLGAGSDYLDAEVVYEIVESEENGSDDRFEPNNSIEDPYHIQEPLEYQWFWGSAQDEDWYRVALEKGDDFYAFLQSPSDDLDVRIFDGDGHEVGSSFYHGSRIDVVDQSNYYYVQVLPETISGAYYNIEFFGSPSDVIPHVAQLGGWDTRLVLLGEEWYFDQVRFSLFDENKEMIGLETASIPEGRLVDVSLGDLFPDTADAGKTAKIINLDAVGPPYGFYSYSTDRQLVNMPFQVEAAQRLFVPHNRNMGLWWTGVALMNADAIDGAVTRMIAYDQEGNLLAESTFVIEPGRNKVGFIEEFGTIVDETAWIEFSSDMKMQGLVIWGTDAASAGIPLLREQHLGMTLFLPLLATSGGWNTDVGLLNPNQESATLSITAYSSAGEEGVTRTLVMAPNGCWFSPIQDLFQEDWDPGFVWARITADRPLCGFQSFDRDEDEFAVLPLLTEGDGKTETCVMYGPTVDTAWTGLVFLNTHSAKTDIWATPFDEEGNILLEEGVLYYNVPHGLAGHHNAVGFVEDLFPGLPPETAYLRVFSEEPILGFGLYNPGTGGKVVDVLYLD
jgi:hypothetical protein